MKYTIQEVHIDLIQAGDTVIHNGVMKTVSPSNIKQGGFLGKTLWGDSYRAGYKPVKLVQFKKGVPR